MVGSAGAILGLLALGWLAQTIVDDGHVIAR